MMKPQPTLTELLARAITSLEAMAAGTAEMTLEALEEPARAHAVARRVAKRRGGKNPDHPIHAQLGRIEATVAGNEKLRVRWKYVRKEGRKQARQRHKPRWERGWGGM
jgi:hypothetical protein